MNNTNDNHDAFIIKQEEVLSKEEKVLIIKTSYFLIMAPCCHSTRQH